MMVLVTMGKVVILVMVAMVLVVILVVAVMMKLVGERFKRSRFRFIVITMYSTWLQNSVLVNVVHFGNIETHIWR